MSRTGVEVTAQAEEGTPAITLDGLDCWPQSPATPDSSRFWPADAYKPGRDQPSFDKQFVRDYLDKIKFDRTPPGPVLPAEIVQKTRAKYIEAYTRLTEKDFAWE